MTDFVDTPPKAVVAELFSACGADMDPGEQVTCGPLSWFNAAVSLELRALCEAAIDHRKTFDAWSTGTGNIDDAMVNSSALGQAALTYARSLERTDDHGDR